MEELQKEGVGNDLTRGSAAKQLIRFSIPLIGAYLLQSLYSMSAVNIVAQVARLPLSFLLAHFLGLGVGRKEAIHHKQTGLLPVVILYEIVL